MGKCTYRDEHGKNCTKCGEYKTWDLFHSSTSHSDGFTSWCRACTVKKTRELRARNRPPKNDPALTGLKDCSRCKTLKPVSEFYRFKSGKDEGKLHSWCKTCQAESGRARKNKKRGLPPQTRLKERDLPEGTVRRPPGNDYVRVKVPGHHRASRFGWVAQHILVAEEKYGIKITQDYSVHHKNGDKTDNRPSNLDLRVGQHGRDADVMDRLLLCGELRERAIELLRTQYDFVVAPRSGTGATNKKSVSAAQEHLVVVA